MKPSQLEELKASKLKFDFTVPDYRPVYKRGSGPKLLPISLSLPNDKPDVIKDRFEAGDKVFYIVGDKSQRADRRRVPAAEILDYVSRRTYEDYEAAFLESQEQEIRSENEPSPPRVHKKGKMKKAPKPTTFVRWVNGVKILETEEDHSLQQELPSPAFPPKGSDSGRTSPSSGMFVGQIEKEPGEKTDVGTEVSINRFQPSPQTAQQHPPQPPVKPKPTDRKRIQRPFLSDTSDEEEEESIEILNSNSKNLPTSSLTPLRSTPNLSSTRGESQKRPLDDLMPSTVGGPPNKKQRKRRSVVSRDRKYSRDKRARAGGEASENEGDSASGSSSGSREETPDEEICENKREENRAKRDETSESESETGLEYDVEKLVDHKFELSNDSKPVEVRYYQIKWMGYDELTWEPEEHILDKDLIATYHREKERAERTRKTRGQRPKSIEKETGRRTSNRNKVSQQPEPSPKPSLELSPKISPPKPKRTQRSKSANIQSEQSDAPVVTKGFKEAKEEHFAGHVPKPRTRIRRTIIVSSDEDDDIPLAVSRKATPINQPRPSSSSSDNHRSDLYQRIIEAANKHSASPASLKAAVSSVLSEADVEEEEARSNHMSSDEVDMVTPIEDQIRKSPSIPKNQTPTPSKASLASSSSSTKRSREQIRADAMDLFGGSALSEIGGSSPLINSSAMKSALSAKSSRSRSFLSARSEAEKSDGPFKSSEPKGNEPLAFEPDRD